MVQGQPTRPAITERDSNQTSRGRVKANPSGLGETEPATLMRSQSVRSPHDEAILRGFQAPQSATAPSDRSTVPDIVTLGRPVAPRADAVLSGLRFSPMFVLADQVYQSHQPDRAGQCQSCGTRGCRTRAHAATVIAAAGVNPGAVDMPTGCSHRVLDERRRTTTGHRLPVRVMAARRARSRPSQVRGLVRRHWSAKSWACSTQSASAARGLPVSGLPSADVAAAGWGRAVSAPAAGLARRMLGGFALWLFARTAASPPCVSTIVDR